MNCYEREAQKNSQNLPLLPYNVYAQDEYTCIMLSSVIYDILHETHIRMPQYKSRIGLKEMGINMVQWVQENATYILSQLQLAGCQRRLAQVMHLRPM